MLSFKRVITHTFACATGMAAGAALFRLPEWACGVLRWELAPVWLAAIAGLLAAGTTVLAVVVALRSGKAAIEAEQQLRRQEALDAVVERHRQARSVAACYLPSLYSLALNSELWRLQLDDPKFVFDGIVKDMSALSLEVLDNLASKVDLFDSPASGPFGLAYGVAKILIAQAVAVRGDLNMWSNTVRDQQRGVAASQMQNLVRYSTDAYKAFEQLAAFRPAEDNPKSAALKEYESQIARFKL